MLLNLARSLSELRVPFRGAEYDVSGVPGVMVGEKLMITRNPWRDEESAQVVCVGDDGRDSSTSLTV